VAGGDVILRWRRELSEHSDWMIQFYYDRTERHWPNAGFREDRDTVDVDFQRRFPLGSWNSVIWGFGYRNSRDKIRNPGATVAFYPEKRADDLLSYFVQDQMTLEEDLLYLTVGSKFVHNDYTGFEYQPTVRLLWTPSERHSIWTSVSRAVRTPTRAEDDMTVLLPLAGTMPNPFPPPAEIPVFPLAIGNRDMESEELIAYEAGVRVQPTQEFSWDLAVFFHDYEDLRSLDFGSVVVPGYPVLLPARTGNENSAETYGFEIVSSYLATPCWRLSGGYSFLVVTGVLGSDGADPRNQFYAQSSWDLPRCWQLDVIWRYVDTLSMLAPSGEVQHVPKYNVMDVRLARYVRPGLELAFVGRHLLDDSHPEFVTDPFLGNVSTEVQREFYGMLAWRY
jgi:iron complex outermembrane receptor protein